MLCSSLSRVPQGLLGRATGCTSCVNKYHRAEAPKVVHEERHELKGKSACTRIDVAKTLKTVKDIPGPGGLCSLPYIGSMFLFHPFTKYTPDKSHLVFYELYRKYGRIVKFRSGQQWSVMLFDPELIEEASKMEGIYPERPGPPLADVYCSRTGRQKGIGQVQGEEWLNMRRPFQEFLLQPANVNQYTPALNEVANDLISTLSRQNENENSPLMEIMQKYAIESSAVYCINTRLGFLQNGNESASPDEQGTKTANASKCPYSGDFRRLSEEERLQMLHYARIYMKSVGNGYYTFPLYKYVRTKLYNDFEKSMKFLSNLFEHFCPNNKTMVGMDVTFASKAPKISVVYTRMNELAARIKAKGQDPEKVTGRPNLLHSLIHDGRVDLMTCTIMLAGFFSTATDQISKSLSIFLWYLAKNPSKQAKLREEINSCVTSKETVDSDTLGHMPYLKACLKESFRLTFPSPAGSIRVMPEDVNLAGYHIPAGTRVYFCQNPLGHSPKYFENPEEYIPERWSKNPGTETDVSLRRLQSIITMPFGFGKRNCLGRRLAEHQIYLAIIKILQNYELHLGNPNEELEIVYRIIAQPVKPLDIRFYPLHQ